ncbi:MAG: metalloregulator ArsR/SmtB family transcription factor [Opitutales bacterium]|nr:metalloregulator ArsR/SmtB family transcription factor [Opitutales bacterium]
MQFLRVYQCLCDETRLRILNLLLEGPLCVCHLTEILEIPQPKVSRHLKGLRDGGALETERCCNWTICRLPKTPNALLEANLRCLQDLRTEEPQFKADLVKREQTIDRILNHPGEDLPAQIRSLGLCCS